jgi:hypothetical protein
MTRRLVENYTMSQSMGGKRGVRNLNLKLRLDADMHALVRQLAASALVSRSKPKKATIAHGAVVLTVIEETATT